MAEDELEARILKKLYVLLVAGGVVIGGVGGTGVLRVDKFTRTDAQLMEQRLERKIEVQNFLIRNDMPPKNTKERIRAIEHCLEHKCTNFSVETTGW